MTNPEFKVEFDILYNNISSNQAPGLSNYEKSFFLTLAQDQILEAYLNPSLNKLGDGYDDNAQRHLDFANITVTKKFTPNSSFPLNYESLLPEKKWHKLFRINSNGSSTQNDDILQIINEVVIVTRSGVENYYLQCNPLDYGDYSDTQSRPYKFPTKNQAWRIINTGSSTEKDFEIIAGFGDEITGYIIKYIRKPQPIILEDLPNGLTIRGRSTSSSCELDSIIHRDILQRAVELAKAAYASGNFQDIVATGLTSATQLGIISKGGNE